MGFGWFAAYYGICQALFDLPSFRLVDIWACVGSDAHVTVKRSHRPLVHPAIVNHVSDES
jgi:hypothetical protein